jgi:ribosomal protein S12 methylthiotransferase accessory factor
LFSESQFEERINSNQQDPSGFQHVPERYRDDPIEWSPARSLVTGQTRFLPSAAVYLGFTGNGSRFCKGDSNGLASGNCLEEAILQGFLELVERDAVALWWYNRVQRPGVDLGSFENPLVSATEDLYAGLDRHLWVLDLTTDLGIPSFAALSAVFDGEREDIIFGFGSHLDAELALMRALSELNQMLPTILPSMEERRRQLLPEFEHAIAWWETARLKDHPYLSASTGKPSKNFGEYTRPDHGDILEAVEECVGRANRAGLDVLVHDLTRSDIGFPVVRVMVPGLRHFWRRLAPGRLFDIPVQLGWLEEALPEESMNPVSMFV